GYMVGLLEVYGIFLASRVWPWILPYRIVFPLLIMSVTLLVFPRGLAGVQLSSALLRFRKAGGAVRP
ncbi:MAG: hypothetical protein NZ733_01040, partial [Aigarchaeota archaeon]|nr:hypothetical protein [Aigarchaeota archaeon]